MRVATLARQGFRRTALDTALRGGTVMRIRNGWVAMPDADPLLIGAARHGVVLGCLTQARRLGLWVHDPAPCLHVAAAPHGAGRKPAQCRVHWAEPILPRDPDALVDPLENVLVLVAECEPYEQALATWESALRQGLATRESLSRLPLRPAARLLFSHAIPFSDAGTETYLRVRLRWLGLPLRVQVYIAGHRVDALLGDRLVLQVDGGHHVGAQRDEDNRHDAELKLRGYHVIRVGYRQLMDDWPAVHDLIVRAVAQGLHRT